MLAFTPIPTIGYSWAQISTHGLLIAIGFVVAELLARRAAKKRGIEPELVDNAAIIAVIAGLIGARLVYVVSLGWDMNLWEVVQIWKGGLSSHGGYIFGIIAGLWYVRNKNGNLKKFADAVLPYLLIGWAIGRLGCFLNWDSFGKIAAVPWAVIVYGEPRHATQIYEALGYLAAFFFQLKVAGIAAFRRKKPGCTAALALFLFALVRFSVDFWRADSELYFLMSQIITAFIIAFSFVYMI